MSTAKIFGQFDQAVQAIHAAALDDALWAQVFAAMDDFCGLAGGQFTALEAGADGQPVPTFAACYINGDPHQEVAADWTRNYAQHSENVPRIARLPVGRPTHNEELFTEAEKRTSLMYNEFQPKYDCRDQLAVVVSRATDVHRPDDFLMWTMRNGRRDWSGADRLDRIRSLLPHIDHAVRVSQALAAAEAASPGRAWIGGAPLGVLHLDRRGRIVHVNDVARRLFAADVGVYEEGGMLRGRCSADDAKLRRLIAAALPCSTGAPAGGALRIAHPALPEKTPLTLRIHPVTPGRADFGDERLAVLVLIEVPVCAVTTLDADQVAKALNLTARKGFIAARLAEGRSLIEIAASLDVQVETIRGHLKEMYEKTGHHGQPQLVRHVLQTVAATTVETV